MNALNQEYEKIAQMMLRCESIFFITGAGMSADSGLPTYRGAGGLYNNTVTEEGIPIEMVLAGSTLQENPMITWKYLLQIEQRCRNARYNKGHAIIAECQDHFKRVLVLTQNIDGYHQQAGSREVIDIHGDMHVLICTECPWTSRLVDYQNLCIPPLCPDCGAVARPDVVFFGEMLSRHKLERLSRELEQGFDLYISIGTTSVFPYIQQPIVDAKAKGKFTIEINPAETSISGLVDARLPVGASGALERLMDVYFSKRKAKQGSH